MTSTVKVNNVQASDGGNIINQCGTNITIGASGDTIALASGASQTGFGRTGAVNWQTTKKTANFTATSGEGYFCDTAASGAFTLTLPSSPSAGDIVGLKDYTGNFETANLTIGRGGSNLSGTGADKVLDTNHLSLTLVYVDATEGWVPVEEGTGFIGETFITATGGTITTSGNCKIHTFTGPGTFCVSQISSTAANNQVSYIVVAGGGSGGGFGGGGAGGFREDKSPVTPYTASPLEGAGPITVTATAFPITVGGGGSAGTSGCSGNNSIFSTITSAGGGGGGGFGSSPTSGKNGGSGGGGGSPNSSPYPGQPGGTGNTPPVSPPQGNNGGPGITGAAAGGGGGGATAAGIGGSCTPATNVGGNGGAGATTSINASPTTFAGGGGAGGGATVGSGGSGGGGNGGLSPGTPAAVVGTANTGGGGGGSYTGSGAAGGSGIVIIRYKYQ